MKFKVVRTLQDDNETFDVYRRIFIFGILPFWNFIGMVYSEGDAKSLMLDNGIGKKKTIKFYKFKEQTLTYLGQ